MDTVVIGTAGHIDHGKSALVKALTGIDPDRLKEEQERGITIDLGFAHASAGGTTLAFVDVPGHERFVRNMLAGAGGIDAVLLVVDAGESVRPQTREHFEICRLLGLTRGVIALSKVDVAGPEQLRRAEEDARALVAGSFLETAPVVPVSAHTGEGLDALRKALEALAGFPPRQHRPGVVRLPIDRAFAMKGFGAVVTGTLVSGTVSAGDTLTVLPEDRLVRVRGLQVHGRGAPGVTAPQRVAVNLAGIDVADLRRGMTLTTTGALAATRRADVRLHLLPGAPALRHGARLRVHHGAAEWFARVSVGATRASGAADWVHARPGDARVAVAPSGLAYARLRFERPAVLTRGDRLVLRASSPPTTIGGGVVLDPEPPAAGIRRSGSLARFVSLELEKHAADPVLVWLAERGRRGLDVNDLVRRGGLDPETARERLTAVARSARGVSVGSRVVPASSMAELEAAILADIDAFHAREPGAPGALRAEIRERTAGRAYDDVFDEALRRLVASGTVAAGERLARAGHRPVVAQGALDLRARVEAAIREAGLAPREAGALATLLSAPAAEVEAACRALVRDRRLVRIGDLAFHPDVLEALKQEVRSLGARGPNEGRTQIDIATFKQRFGLTRKHAIPLLEWLDRERVTRRVGDARIVL